MIVIDSSVWIGNLRNLDTVPVRKLRAIDHGVDQVLVGDLILLEVLQGARDDRHAFAIETHLRSFPVAAMLDGGLASIAARNYRTLQSRGVMIRKTVDLVIGTFCIERGHRLLHDNRDFEPIAAYLGLQTV